MKKAAFLFIAFIIYCNLSAQNVGIGTNNPSQKLEVVGNFRVSGAIMPGGIAGTAGQALISNGVGAPPTWENLSYSGGGRFWVIPTNNTVSTGSSNGRAAWDLTAGTTQLDSLDFGSTHEMGSDFTISNPGTVNNYITVNRTGLYHFDGVLRYFVTCVLSVTMLPRATLDFLANQTTFPNLSLILFEDPMDKTGGAETSNGANNFNYTAKFQFSIHLDQGTTFTFRTGFNLLRFPSGTDLLGIGVSSGGYITGHFISE